MTDQTNPPQPADDLCERLRKLGTALALQGKSYDADAPFDAEARIRQQEAEIAGRREKIRGLVATLYCASGCSCCRDDDTWDETAAKLGRMLDIPKYEDDSGYDFYTVRDQFRQALKGSSHEQG